MQPRDYQLRAVEDCRQAYKAGATSVLLVLPTGGGKTLIGSLVVAGALARGRRVLWLAGRRELVEQAAARMPGEAGVIMAGRPARPDAPVQVASIDTLAARGGVPDVDLVVIDEAHHATATTWRAVLAAAPRAKLLGLTATPERSDGAALGDVFQSLVLGPTIRQLVELGHLVPTRVISPCSKSKKLAMEPADAWARYSEGRPGFAFHKLISESLAFTAAMNERGIVTAHVDGETPIRWRAAAVEAFRRGEVECLSSVAVFTEGVDVPRASFCLLARGADHAGIYLQMVGRVMRPAPGKHDAVVVDLRGVYHKHGLPDADREWSLAGAQGVARSSPTKLRQCVKCGAVWEYDGDAACPECGFSVGVDEQEVKPRPLAEVRGPLRPRAGLDEVRRKRQELTATARARGYSMGWVYHRLVAIYGAGMVARAGA